LASIPREGDLGRRARLTKKKELFRKMRDWMGKERSSGLTFSEEGPTNSTKKIKKKKERKKIKKKT